MSIGLDNKLFYLVTVATLILFSIFVIADLSGIQINQPSENGEISGTYTITAQVTGSGNQNTTTVYFFISNDGSSWESIGEDNEVGPSNTFSIDYDTTLKDDGNYYFNVTATDGNDTVTLDTPRRATINNIVVPDPSNLKVSDLPNDQGGSLNMSWNWDGSWDNLETFTIILDDGSFVVNTSVPFYVDSGLTDCETYCYSVRAVGSSGDVSGWTGPVCAEPNAEPIMDGVVITPENPTKLDTVQCVGFMHDINYGFCDFSFSALYYITGIRYPTGSNDMSGTVNCFPINESQWEDVEKPNGATHECIVTITNIEKGDKYSCYMTPYDGKEYGVSNYTQDAQGNPKITYINNSRPTAQNVHVEQIESNDSTTLSCNYTFFDNDLGDTENTTEARFFWYKNIDGLNNWVPLEGQNGRTLVNTDEQTWFSKDDKIKCSVMVKDIDYTWPVFVNHLFDSEYRNSTIYTVQMNANPGLANDWNDANSSEYSVEIGDTINFFASWIDEDDSQINMYVCENFMSDEEQYSDGLDNISFGNTTSVWFYTNRTGMTADTISIRPFDWEGSGNRTNHTYDIYAYEVDEKLTTDTNFLIGKVNDVSLTMNEYNTFKLEYSAAAYPDKYIGFKICLDNDNDEECDNGGEGVFIHANSTSGDYEAMEIGVSSNTTYYDPDIKINYLEGGVCDGKTYCNTTSTSSNPVSCSFTASSNEEWENDYKIKVCDDEGACSNIRSNTFYVNRKPIIDWVNISPSYPLNNQTITCSYSAHDPDGHDITNNQTFWYYRNESLAVWEYYGPADHINPSRTNIGQQWICEYMATDQYSLANKKNSSISFVVVAANDSTPFIVDMDSNEPTNPVNVGEELSFVLDWEMINSTGEEDMFLYICDSPEIDLGGCTGKTYYQSPVGGEVMSDPFFANYTAVKSDDTNQTYYSKICYELDCSSVYSSVFYVNHRPTAQNVAVSPGYPNTKSDLNCTYEYNFSGTGAANSSDVCISNNENASLALFKWHINGVEVPGENGQVLDYPFVLDDEVSCSVKLGDVHGLYDDKYVNSSNVTIRSISNIPIIWPLPDSVNESILNIIGYINDNTVLNVTGQALDNENTPHTNVTTQFERTIKLGDNVIVENITEGSNYIKINSTSHKSFNSSTYLRIENQNRTYFEYYNITGKVKIEGVLYDYYKVYISPNLEENVTVGIVVHSYNNSYPNGWFNLSLNLWEGENTLRVRGKNSVGSGATFEDNVYFDNHTPVFDLYMIPNGTITEEIVLDFNISDDYGLNMSTLLLNISNGTYNKNYYYDENISCFDERAVTDYLESENILSGGKIYEVVPYSVEDWVVFQVHYDNSTDTTDLMGEGDSYTLSDGSEIFLKEKYNNSVKYFLTSLDIQDKTYCFVETLMDMGDSNLTFSITDKSGNFGSEAKEITVGNITQPAPDVYIESSIVHDTELFMSWNISTGDPTSVSSLEYTVGDEPYPNQYWYSVTDGWVTATQEEINNGNLTTDELDLVDDETYYFNVRYKKYSWSDWSLIGTSPSIKYLETQEPSDRPTPVEITTPREVHNTEVLNASWTESTASEGYNIDYYEYAVGISKYPDSGWNITSDGWINNGLDRNVSREFNLTNKGTYYFSVRAIDDGGLVSNITSSGPTTYYNQIAPTATVMSVENDTYMYDGWLDDVNNSLTNITVHGNRNITCYYSEYDRKFIDMVTWGDSKCNASGEWGENLTCQIPNLTIDNQYTFHIACKDSDGREQNRDQNTQVVFSIDFSPPVINVIHPTERNYTKRQGKFGFNDVFLFNITDYPGGVGGANVTISNATNIIQTGDLVFYSYENSEFSWFNENYTEGNYSITVESWDNFNHYSTYTRNFTLDKTPPNITADILGEVNGSYFREGFNVTTNIQDYTNVTYTVTNTNVSGTNTSVGYGNDVNWTTYVNVSGLEDGEYLLNYIAKDSVDNTVNSSVNFYVDNHAWFNQSNPIGNYTLVEEKTFSNALDLDEYFLNLTTEDVEYTYSGNENISIEIPVREEVLLSDWENSGESGSGYVVMQFSDTNVILMNANGTFYQNVTANSSTKYMLTGEHKSNNTNDFVYSVIFSCYNDGEFIGSEQYEFNSTASWKGLSFNYTTLPQANKIKIELSQKYDSFNQSTNSQWRNFNLYKYYDHGHMVSFTPNDNWVGVEYVTFYANDSFGVIQPSNTIKLNVTEDYCNPPSSGPWVLNQTQTAQCSKADQSLLNNLDYLNITDQTVMNMSSLVLNIPIRFKDNSTGYARNSILHDTLYLTDNSTFIAWNTSLNIVELKGDSTLEVYNSPQTIITLNIDGNQNLRLDNENVGSATFRRTSGEIINSTINSSTFYINGTGEIFNLKEGVNNGYINTTDMNLNFTNVLIGNVSVYSLSDSLLNVNNSYITMFDNEGTVNFYDSYLGTLRLDGNSSSNFTNCSTGVLIPDTDSGETSVIYGNLSVGSKQSISAGKIERHYPFYAYNGEGNLLSDLNVTVQSNYFSTSGGYVEFPVEFNSSNCGDEIIIYTDGLNLINISLDENTPVSLQDWLLDPDGDENPILNDTDDDNDGIVDSSDSLTGDETWIETNTAGINISVNGSYNLNQIFSGTLFTVIHDSYGIVASFYWNYSESTLELQYINITKGKTSNKMEYLVINGLEMQNGLTKTVYLNKTNSSSRVCVYDEDSVSLTVLTSDINCAGGVSLYCPGTSGGYSCSIESNTTLNITGLAHSGVIQMTETTTTTSSTTTTIDGGGGGGTSGGSSGGYTGATSINVSQDRVEINGLSMSKDIMKTVDIEDWNGMVYRIVFYPINTVYNAQVIMEKLDEWHVFEVPRISRDGWKLYHYLKVDTSNINDRVDNIDFYFSVDKDWIRKNNVGTVSLWKYDGGWKELETEEIKEIADKKEYKSNFEGFSHFAIMGKVRETTTSIIQNPIEDDDTVCGNGICEFGEDEEDCPSDCGRSSRNEIDMIWLIPLILVILIIFGIKLYFKKHGRGAPKPVKIKPTPPPDHKLRIGDIVAEPDKYKGKRVKIDGKIVYSEFIPEENRMFYRIKDSTGQISGLCRHAGYEGRGVIKGIVRKKDGKLYIEF